VLGYIFHNIAGENEVMRVDPAIMMMVVRPMGDLGDFLNDINNALASMYNGIYAAVGIILGIIIVSLLAIIVGINLWLHLAQPTGGMHVGGLLHSMPQLTSALIVSVTAFIVWLLIPLFQHYFLATLTLPTPPIPPNW